MKKPNQIGVFLIEDIDIKEVIPFIDWRFYFTAWRLPGRYEGIEKVHDCPGCEAGWLQGFEAKDREKASEALKLLRDTQELLREVVDAKSLTLNATYSFFPARSKDEDIFVRIGSSELKIVTLRQQKPATDGFCYSLADFLAEDDDYIGAFANTVIGAEEISQRFDKEDDVFRSILIKTLADRLAEATAEWLHWKVRKEFWGYVPDENISMEDMLKAKYSGIRPAVGYPSLPDQSLIFDLKPMLKFNEAGIMLTENGAMFPNASVCGIYFDHPKSKYFMIGKIDNEQLEDYARRKAKPVAELKKWLAANL